MKHKNFTLGGFCLGGRGVCPGGFCPGSFCPGTEIEQCVRSCKDCVSSQNNPSPAPLHPWEDTTKPWARLHVDYAGPFLGKMFLIVIDSFSKWIDAYPVTTASSTLTIEKLRQ